MPKEETQSRQGLRNKTPLQVNTIMSLCKVIKFSVHTAYKSFLDGRFNGHNKKFIKDAVNDILTVGGKLKW